MLKRLLFCTLIISPNLSADPILKTTTSWDGGVFTYPEGQAEVTSIILRIEEGKTPRFHCHPVPTLGYVLSGSLEVETREGKKVAIEQGQSVVEVMRTVHRGIATGGDAEIVVFYAGAEGIPVTVFPEDDPEDRYCSP